MSPLKNCRILLVDDTKTNIDLLVHTLKDDYRLSVALNGLKAIEYSRTNRLDLILLDVKMPGMDGFEVCKKLKENPPTHNIPIIFLTAMDKQEDKRFGLSMGAVDYITKPFDISEVKARIKMHLTLKVTQEAISNRNLILEEKVKQRTAELKETQVEIINRLGLASKYRDYGTGQNIKRISFLSELIGKAAGMTNAESEMFALSSTLHDVGKIGITDEILMKNDSLTEKEFKIMKAHTQIGAKLLSGSKSKLIQQAEIIALTHHEKWNGTGYNNGLKKEEIPLTGRIVSICDMFDALISRRPYKTAWPFEKAFMEIEKQSGESFDPYLVKLFIKLKPEILKIVEKTA